MGEPEPARPRRDGKSGAPSPDGQTDLQGMFRIWVDSDLKVQLLVFFHDNPGVMETADGLARRLGLNRDVLVEQIRDHVELGILKERDLGTKKIYVYNRGAERSVADRLRTMIEHRMQDGAA